MTPVSSVSLGVVKRFALAHPLAFWCNRGMTPKQRLIARFRALCDRTAGGIEAVAVATGLSFEGLQQIYRGTALPSGEPRGVGPKIQRELSAAFPGWDEETAEPAYSPGAHAVAQLYEKLPPSEQLRVRAILEAFQIPGPMLDALPTQAPHPQR